ncbi:MAG: DNA repair protein RecO [Oscillatoriaceae bacterium SKW80]|nr:DNA repair protein RecO [Oscillatoriaceae bacterium SKYG93]MCX8120884.1 DNA repair protein RecO [Oscillatoriaceae bacterium SKW80]MDW8452157.1 DNA repair protein RecO [Oscillatoriaceae cyanobacterium SKYGB_i_bin93]HIK27367.1 DNA repair protein RecO [Oscillatoriaceae cyanobacterium M7585_C2015_266]
MGRIYTATGINLKGMALGESDRLLTILTREYGLIRAIAPGARKPHSRLGGRSGLFVVNELLLYKGRSLDKITQAETITSYPGLSQDFGKLAASQYLAEIALCQALSEQPQEELFYLLNEHLSRLERLPAASDSQMPALLFAHLAHGIFHLLALAGIAPQVHSCCLTQQILVPDFFHPDWQAGFSIAAGGIVSLSEGENPNNKSRKSEIEWRSSRVPANREKPLKLDIKLNALELSLLQQLALPNLSWQEGATSLTKAKEIANAWLSIERILRQYTQHHFGCSLRSAALIDTYFNFSANSPVSYDATV